MPVIDQGGKLAASEKLTGQVIEPHRHPQGGQLGERIMLRAVIVSRVSGSGIVG